MQLLRHWQHAHTCVIRWEPLALPLHLFRGAYELMTIYGAQGYSPHLFRSALAALGSKFSEPLWFAISAFIGTVTP